MKKITIIFCVLITLCFATRASAQYGSRALSQKEMRQLVRSIKSKVRLLNKFDEAGFKDYKEHGTQPIGKKISTYYSILDTQLTTLRNEGAKSKRIYWWRTRRIIKNLGT